MIEFELPLTVAITTWRDQKTIDRALKSVMDFADFIVVVYGKPGKVD
ncbi:unnamed protein product, partial [marine sediment metagenome]